MSARITIERVLRDDDDESGQTVREWKIEVEPGFVTLKSRNSAGFLLIRAADVDQLAADLERAKHASAELAAEPAP